MTPYNTVRQFSKMLRNLDQWITKAEAHAKTKGFDAEVLVNQRLAPDMYNLTRQVQSACDAAKFAAVYLSGKKAPAQPDTETTLAQLHERLAATLGWLESVSEADLAGAAAAKVSPPWLRGAWLHGEDYLLQAALPNFFFHVTTAYAILRHSGVDLGKTDFIGSLPVQTG